MLTGLNRLAAPVFLGGLPLLLLALVIRREYATDAVAVDFHNVFYPAAERVVDGDSPYVEVIDERTAYVYSPVLAYLVAPYTLLPLGVAEALASVALIACFVTTPYVLGVRDWRVVGLMLLWAPFVSGLQTANVTFLLGFLCALAWRWRDRQVAPGLAIGLAVALKPFVWPLAFWLLATRRFASFAVAVLAAVISVALVLPFESLGVVASLLREHGELFDAESYTPYALLVGIGVPEAVARATWLGIGAALLYFGRRNFILCVAAALALSPIVWLHYFALLAVPLGIAAAPIWVWALPILLWLAPGVANGETRHQLLVLGVAAATITACAVAPGARMAAAPNREVASDRGG